MSLGGTHLRALLSSQRFPLGVMAASRSIQRDERTATEKAPRTGRVSGSPLAHDASAHAPQCQGHEQAWARPPDGAATGLASPSMEEGSVSFIWIPAVSPMCIRPKVEPALSGLWLTCHLGRKGQGTSSRCAGALTGKSSFCPRQ